MYLGLFHFPQQMQTDILCAEGTSHFIYIKLMSLLFTLERPTTRYDFDITCIYLHRFIKYTKITMKNNQEHVSDYKY